MAEDLTAADLWADIIAAHRLETPPEGAKCVIEFAEEIGKSEKHARDILNGYVRRGMMQSAQFCRPQDNKRATYYWPVREGV